jgi:hypothetical protein
LQPITPVPIDVQAVNAEYENAPVAIAYAMPDTDAHQPYQQEDQFSPQHQQFQHQPQQNDFSRQQLPSGWLKKTTPEGNVYYVNHSLLMTLRDMVNR